MLLCSKCKKRPAVVFISQMGKNDTTGGIGRGLCISCAMEEGIPQVQEYMKRMGLSDEDIKELAEAQVDIDEGDSFEQGGSSTLPEIFGNLMGNVEKLFNNQNMMPPAERDEQTDGTDDNTARRSPRMRRERGAKSKDTPKLKYLSSYCTDLSQKAADGELDNIIGRDREIARVIQILSRRQKNNPCLIGEAGVGKTAIAEGIAQRINSGNVPFRLADKKIFLLDMAALVAGTQFRGQFESRCKGLIEEVKRLGNVILFIDEIHSIVGAGDSEGSMSASNILKPALSRGEIQVIGATTFKEYRKYIEKDGALERRFQPVTVNEPTIADTVKMLQGIKKYYEQHHHIAVPDETVRLCATLSERYITDRFLPDKAIDLLDEACAYASTRSRELERIQWIESDRSRLKAELETEEAEEKEPDYEHIADLKMQCMKLDTEFNEIKPAADAAVVTEEDLAHVIEIWTGIPASKIEQEEYEKIRSLPEALSKRVIGQADAVNAVCAAIRRSRAHLSKRVRPASFIFVGPTGVGKTELVKALGETLFDDVEPIIRVDMSEYMEKHSVSKLIGSPPGYVGFDEAGQLTEKVRRKPYSVVLFDEIEKAHPDVMNIMLQILDEGEIHDAQGRSVSFKNTVIVMTSNAGSTDKDTGVGFNKTEKDITREKAMKALREFLRPEFLGRIDEIVVFDPLTQEDYEKIAALMLDEIKEPLAERAITMTYKDSALKAIAQKAFGHKLGGRDIRRVIREQVEDKIADLFIEKGESNIGIICVYAENGEIAIKAG